MTGPGPGKIELEARVYIWRSGTRQPVDAVVYLHVKGWSRAFVTHLDIEKPGLEYELLGGPGRGVYGATIGTGRGLQFTPFHTHTWRLEVEEYHVLPRALPRGARYPGYMGSKTGGVFIGFRREVLRVLEEIAAREYGVEPRGKRREH